MQRDDKKPRQGLVKLLTRRRAGLLAAMQNMDNRRGMLSYSSGILPLDFSIWATLLKLHLARTAVELVIHGFSRVPGSASNPYFSFW